MKSETIVKSILKDKKKAECPPTSTTPEKNTKITEKTKPVDTQKVIPEIKIPWPARPNSKPIKTVQKLPHLRSKTPLKRITVTETDGITDRIKDINKPSSSGLQKNLSDQNKADKEVLVADLAHLHVDKTPEIHQETKSIDTKIINRPVPKSSVQFVCSWKMMKNDKVEKYLYLRNIKPEDIPKIFQDAMESDIFGDIIDVLSEKFIENGLDVFLYLKYLATVKRFSTLVMFMSSNDKKGKIIYTINFCLCILNA